MRVYPRRSVMSRAILRRSLVREASVLALLFLSVLLGCGGDGISPEDRERATELVEYGVYLAEEGYLDSAANVLEEAIRYDSTNVEALYRLGMVYEYTLQSDQAEVAYRRALRQDTSLAVVHFNLGQLCGRTERYDEALRHFEAVLASDTTKQLLALTHYCVGLTQGVRGNFGEAAAAYGNARKIDTLFARAYLGEGQELLRLERYEEAVSALGRALRLDSTLSDAHSHLATAYRRLNRMDDALAAEQAHHRARVKSRGQ